MERMDGVMEYIRPELLVLVAVLLGVTAGTSGSGAAAGAAAAPGRVHCTAAGGLQPARAVALPADRFK